MKAASWSSTAGGIHKNMKVVDAPLPESAKNLANGDTLVKVAYASLNPVDFKVPEAPLVGSLMFSKGIPALDFAGTVVESTLPDLKPGMPVFGTTDLPKFGTCAEYAVVPKHSCVPVPDGLPLEQAATLGIAGLTAYQTLVPFVQSGAKVFINGGSGGVGTYQIQIAKAIGCHVTTTCSGPNVELCQSLGADEVIDYRTQDVLQTLTRKGQNYDLIVDDIFANANLYWSAHKYLKPDAKYVTIAGSPQFSTISAMLQIFLWPKFLGGGQRKFQFVTCAGNVAEYEKLAAMVAEDKVKIIIEKIYELAETDKAYERLKSGRTRGKLVVKVA
jgi:NADPH:quinone reductase-like Zn-dependent oxidoreductase